MKIMNINKLPEKYEWQDSAGLITKCLGEACGSKKIYVNIDTIPFNAYSTKYHSHTQQEEFFLVLSGEGVVRINDQKLTVTKGDCLSKPAGRSIAHTFYNSSKEPLVILDVGTREKEDTCYYLDEDVYMVKSGDEKHVFNGSSQVTEWSSAPNERAVESNSLTSS